MKIGGSTMRPTLWFILILSFAAGWGGAYAVRQYCFEAKLRPVTSAAAEPQVKILVAKQDIPDGIEITADTVEFQDVPVSELPAAYLTDFSQVYRRIPQYPIPAGCPICEDLLRVDALGGIPVGYLPAGRQRITIAVDQILQGISPQPAMLSHILQPSQTVDIRVVSASPLRPSGSKWAKRKNEVLWSHLAPQELRSEGELVLGNVPVLRVVTDTVASQIKNSLELMLEKKDADKLTAASRRGYIRIIVSEQKTDEVISRQDEKPETENVKRKLLAAEKTIPEARNPADLAVPIAARYVPSPPIAEENLSVDVPPEIQPISKAEVSPVPKPKTLFSVPSVPGSGVEKNISVPTAEPKSQTSFLRFRSPETMFLSAQEPAADILPPANEIFLKTVTVQNDLHSHEAACCQEPNLLRSIQ